MSERLINHVVWLPGLLLAGWLAPVVVAGQAAAGKTQEQITDNRLSLVDLPAYRAALSGRATNDSARPSEPAKNATFHDLWDQPSKYQGHRVRVEGRIERIFRQGAVGNFPPLAEAWIMNSTGDLVCIVFPLDDGESHNPGVAAGRPASKIPEKGTAVTFTGTFLRRIRYKASDDDRLAPLVVGDQYPLRHAASATPPALSILNKAATDTLMPRAGDEPRSDTSDWLTGSRGQWILAGLVAVMTVALLVRQQLRHPRPRGIHRRSDGLPGDDPPLEFIEQLSPASDIKPGRNGNRHH